MATPPHAIINSITLDAPRERVWAAFSDPAALARWWGPAGHTNTFHEFDFRPGGAWRFTMRGPDGVEYAMEKRFDEVVAPECIVLRHEQVWHSFTLTMTLAAERGRTEMRWLMLFDDPAEAERLRSFLTEANAQNLKRLATLLSESSTATR